MSRTKKETKTCGECKHFESCRTDNYKEYPACGAFEGITNFDRVTASPEALADFISVKNLEKTCTIFTEGRCKEQADTRDCDKCFINWLKQEAEDEKWHS